jgi:four helix bundle protein
MELAVSTHKLSLGLPDIERFDLARELRRSARSIPSNVAEGFNRHSRAAYRSHVAIALGSQAELETQSELAHRLAYLTTATTAEHQQQIARVGRLLHGLWRALEPR